MRKLQCLLWSDLWSHTYIHRCFHFILFVRNKSLSLVHIQGEENYVPTLERRNIEELMDITWWNRVGNKSCKRTLKIHMLISTAFPQKCNYCPDFCDFCFLVFLYNFTTNCEPLNNTDCFFSVFWTSCKWNCIVMILSCFASFVHYMNFIHVFACSYIFIFCCIKAIYLYL